jgi:hypothetical protein
MEDNMPISTILSGAIVIISMFYFDLYDNKKYSWKKIVNKKMMVGYIIIHSSIILGIISTLIEIKTGK